MHRTTLPLLTAAVTAALIAGPLAATAAPVTSFGPLDTGWNVGSGQPNDGFNITTNDSPEVQLAMRSQDYQVGVSSNDGLGGNYFVTAGERSPGSGLATWNLDLSIYTFEPPIVNNFDIFLDIDWDPTAGVNLVRYDLDDLLLQAGMTGITLYQASENLGFGYWGQAFNPFATGTYEFTLSAYSRVSPDDLAASTVIRVNVGDDGAPQNVPEPATGLLAGAALLGLAASRRRRRGA